MFDQGAEVVLALLVLTKWTLQGPSQSLSVSFVHVQNAGRFCCDTLQPKIVRPTSACEFAPYVLHQCIAVVASFVGCINVRVAYLGTCI